MGIEKPLFIAYSGSLDARRPLRKSSFWNWIKQWFWTYKHDTVDASTRSAYYLIKAVERLKSKQQLSPNQLQIHLWGSIHPLNEIQIKEHGLSDYFSISGYLPKHQSLKKLAETDMLFLPLEKSNIKNRGTLFIPGKLFEYLNIGKPILALCEPSDCREILEKSGLGVCVEPDNPELISEILWHYIQNRNALYELKPREEYIQGFSFRNKTAELASVFKSLNVD